MRAVPGLSDVFPGNRVLDLRQPEFENNDILFTVRSDNLSFAGDVVNWISGSNRLRGQTVASPRFDAGMTVTSMRAMFVQVGLPRNIAERQLAGP